MGSAKDADTRPADGERAAQVGYQGQYDFAARVTLASLPTLEWIRVADPSAGIADDFQFLADGVHHAVQVKWSQYPSTFNWSGLVGPTAGNESLIGGLADAWTRLREHSTPIVIHLRVNGNPSTAKPTSSSVLSDCHPAGIAHFAAFIGQSFDPLRRRLLEGSLEAVDLKSEQSYIVWEPAWKELKRSSGLDDDFLSFVRSLSFEFGPAPDETLSRISGDGLQADSAALAAELARIVADGERLVSLTRSQLLDRLGWADRVSFRNRHAFPIPSAYATNRNGRDSLRAALERFQGGYLALVGPAGSGKSTLLSAMDWPSDRLIRYYAFVPDSPDPLTNRGEAESLLNDLSLALQHAGIHRASSGTDLVTRTSVLLRQLEAAGNRWKSDGERTILIVDGLDHVAREQNPTKSLVDVLPMPAGIPDGVFVLFGTQTTQVLPAPIRQQLAAPGRIVDLPKLKADEVVGITEAAIETSWLSPSQLDDMVSASEGHPLALSYLIKELQRIEVDETDEDVRRSRASAMLDDASRYGGDVESRYQGYYSALDPKSKVVDLLALIARLRVPIDLSWVSEWADPVAVREFADKTAVFFRQEGTAWHFVHNSFRRFLVDQTTPVHSHAGAEGSDSALHAHLAEICRASNSRSVYSHQEIYHRYLADQLDQVLELALPVRLREALVDLEPVEIIESQAILAIRAAADLGDLKALFRSVLFVDEISQRSRSLDPDKLAEAVTKIDAEAGARHVLAGMRPTVSTVTALACAVDCAADGHEEFAKRTLSAVGGLSGALGRRRSYRGGEQGRIIRYWAEAVYRVQGLEEVLSEFAETVGLDVSAKDTETGDRGGRDDPWDEDDAQQHRPSVHSICFDLALESRDTRNLDRLTVLIDDQDGLDWRVRARLARSLVAFDDRDYPESRRQFDELLSLVESAADVAGISLQLRLRAAELGRRMQTDQADVSEKLVPETERPTTRERAGYGLPEISSILDWWRFERLSGRRSFMAQRLTTKSPRDSGRLRFLNAVDELSILEAEAAEWLQGLRQPPEIASRSDAVLRLFEVPPIAGREWSGWHEVTDSAAELHDRVADLASLVSGTTGLSQILDQVERALGDPTRAGYWSPQRMQNIIGSILSRSTDPDLRIVLRAHTERVESAIDELDGYGQVEAWLEQSSLWLLLGDTGRSRNAVSNAVKTSYSTAASENSHQLSAWLDWLEDAWADGTIAGGEFIDQILRYADRLITVDPDSGHETSEAAETLVRLAWKEQPRTAIALASHLCERGMLTEQGEMTAIVIAATQDDSIPQLATATIFSWMCLPGARYRPNLFDEILGTHTSQPERDLIELAAEIWTPRTPTAEEPIDKLDIDVDQHIPNDPLPASPGGLLSFLRQTKDFDDLPQTDWAAATTEILASEWASLPITKGLLDESARLGLPPLAISQLAAHAALLGAPEAGCDALQQCLLETPSAGWFRFYDGGSRLKVFQSALVHGDADIAKLAAQDFAASLTDTMMRTIDVSSMRDIMMLLDHRGTGSYWSEVFEYLEIFAPAATHTTAALSAPADPATSLASLLAWVGTYLGHPVREPDFGARRVLREMRPTACTDVDAVLASVLTRDGWQVEAGLHCLAADPYLTSLSGKLASEIQRHSAGLDIINRELANEVLNRTNHSPVDPTRRPLPGGYQLSLPPVPDQPLPEVDASGLPMIDTSNPLQVLAPYGLLLQHVADAAGLERSAVLHRASAYALSLPSPWIGGGHRQHAQRLRERGVWRMYRPWALMAGRRATSMVLADLTDAAVAGPPTGTFSEFLGLVDLSLMDVTEMPTRRDSPVPWRPADAKSYDVTGWRDEAEPAADEYVKAVNDDLDFLLGESSEWTSLERQRATEERRISTRLSNESSVGDEGPERVSGPAHNYPALPEIGWNGATLLVEGTEYLTDVPVLKWLALHPTIGFRLGWSAGPSPFAWEGADGEWRARSVRRLLGRSQETDLNSGYSCHGWQVELSQLALAELNKELGPVLRSLSVERWVENPQDNAEGHERTMATREL